MLFRERIFWAFRFPSLPAASGAAGETKYETCSLNLSCAYPTVFAQFWLLSEWQYSSRISSLPLGGTHCRSLACPASSCSLTPLCRRAAFGVQDVMPDTRYYGRKFPPCYDRSGGGGGCGGGGLLLSVIGGGGGGGGGSL